MFDGNLSDSDDDFDPKKRKRSRSPSPLHTKRPLPHSSAPSSYNAPKHYSRPAPKASNSSSANFASSLGDFFGDEDNIRKKFEAAESFSTTQKQTDSEPNKPNNLSANNFKKSSFGDKMMVCQK